MEIKIRIKNKTNKQHLNSQSFLSVKIWIHRLENHWAPPAICWHLSFYCSHFLFSETLEISCLLYVLARLIRMAEASHSFHNSSSEKVNSQYLDSFIILSYSSIITGHSPPSYHKNKKFFLMVTHEAAPHTQTMLTVT